MTREIGGGKILITIDITLIVFQRYLLKRLRMCPLSSMWVKMTNLQQSKMLNGSSKMFPQSKNFML